MYDEARKIATQVTLVVADELNKIKGIANIRRALTIARTETHSAFNASNQFAVERSELATEKEWMSALDERTRESHVTANGQRVPLKADFIVNGEPLQYPGDPNGSAANIINCRCIVLYF